MNPGWYQLPTDPTKLVYWDGSQWQGDPIPNPAFVSRPEVPDGIEPSYVPPSATDSHSNGTTYITINGQPIQVMSKKTGRIFGGMVSIVMGIAFLTFTLFSGLFFGLFAVNNDTADQVETTATVVGMEYEDQYCVPLLQRNSEAPIVRAEMTVWVSPCPIKLGDTVTVTHPVDDPNSLRIADESFSGSGLFSIIPVIFGGVGLFLLISGIVSIVKTGSRKPEETPPQLS